MSEKSDYSQLFAGFQHIFMHLVDIIWSYLAENGPQIVKYEYFFARFLEKLIHP